MRASATAAPSSQYFSGGLFASFLHCFPLSPFSPFFIFFFPFYYNFFSFRGDSFQLVLIWRIIQIKADFFSTPGIQNKWTKKEQTRFLICIYNMIKRRGDECNIEIHEKKPNFITAFVHFYVAKHHTKQISKFIRIHDSRPTICLKL